MQESTEKRCLECQNILRGRMDKKFCDNQCRNAHHNRINGNASTYMKRINAALRKNRLILLELNNGIKPKTTRNELLKKGFDFNFITNIYTTKTGKQYFFCYEQGYLPLENDYFALVLKHDYIDG
ncbi:MAG: hypothetical protein H6607_07105 [Flavobacteriales bacterium]|nr:hypothetical protein [Flavobacteriales bacterium]